MRPSVLRAALIGFSTAASVSITSIGRAFALDLDAGDGLITDTVASRDRLRVWDDSKKYGAERISERSRLDFQPDGLRFGNYRIFPGIGAAVTYDNNIFAAPVNRQSDIRTEVAPNVTFKSELPRHVLDLSLGGKIVTFAEHGDQDYANAHAALNGALHFDSAHTLSANLLTSLEHEERQDSTAWRFAAEPLEIVHNRAAVGITRDVGRLYGTLSGTFEQWNYGSVRTTDGSTLDEAYRDTDVFSAQVKAGLRLSPGADAVSRLRFSRFLNAGDGSISRTGNGFEALAGLSFQTSPLLRWRLMGGWGLREYDQDGLASLQSWLAEGEVQWLVTQNLTLYGTLSRNITDQLASDGGSVVETAVKARLEYEIWHNLVLSAGGSYAEDQFQGVTRTDRIWSAKIGIDYYANKNWLFTFGYEHQVRDSTDPAYDMNRDRFTVEAKLRF